MKFALIIGALLVTIGLCLLLSGCAFIEGMRQSDPDYVPRDERIRIRKAVKEWRVGRKQWLKDHATEISEVPELAELP